MLVVILLLVLILCFVVNSCIRPKNYPNGPFLFPFIGSAWSLPSRYCEYKIPEWKKKYGNIIGHKIGSFNVIIICGNEEIIDGLKQPNFQGRIHSKFFLQRSFNQPLGFFFSDDEIWSEVRRFTIRYFGHIVTSKLESIMHDELLEHFSRIKPGEITNIDGPFMSVPLNVIIKMLVGINRSEHQSEIDQIQTITEKSFRAGRATGLEAYYPAYKIFPFTGNKFLTDSAKSIQNFFQERLMERKKNFNSLAINDYTDAFLLKQEKERSKTGSICFYTDTEYLSCILDMVQAGNESTGKTIEFILLYVALNPRIQNKLHEEIDRVVGQSRFPVLEDRPNLPYVEATTLEAMRINPISPMGVIHRVTEDTKFREYFFPQNSFIMFSLKEYLNDSDNWNKPDEFLPERFLENPDLKKKMINFGYGKRICIGELLAKNSIYLYISHFFQKFSIHLPVGYSNPSTIPISGVTNGPKPFKLIITERS